MAQLQETHLNAYLQELQDAEKRFLQAGGDVNRLRETINQKRQEQGLKPLEFGPMDNPTAPSKEESPQDEDKTDAEDVVPPEASGFGSRKDGDKDAKEGKK